MSSLSAVFNSCATVVTMDLYRHIAPKASEHHLLRVGQLVTGIMVILSLAWIPFISVLSSGLYTYIQNVQSYIAPPIAAVFLVGVLWPRANATGAMTALLVGFVIGTGRLVLEMNKASLTGAWLAFVKLNFLHFAFLLFLLSVLILVVVGLLTTEPPKEKLVYLVRWVKDPSLQLNGQSRINIALTVAVVFIVAVIWLYFR